MTADLSAVRFRLPALLVFGAALGLAVASSVLAVLNGGVDQAAEASWSGWDEAATWAAYMLTAAGVGALVLAVHPDNRVGRVAGTGALLGLLALLADQYVGYSQALHDGTLPITALSRIVSHAAFALCWGVLAVVLPAVFPTGRLVSRRWRPVVAVGWAGGAAYALAAFRPDAFGAEGPLGVAGKKDNPLGVPAAVGPLLQAASELGILLLFGGMFLAAASLVVRVVRSRGAERAQVKVVAYTTVVVIVGGLVVANAMNAVPAGSPVHRGLAVIGSGLGLLLPASIGVAVLRYRLYEVDRLINRTVVYSLLTLFLGSGYVLVVTLAGLAVPGEEGGDLAVAAATLVVAALFRPLRGWLQRFIDRRFNRSRYDAEQTVAAFAATLRQRTDFERLGADLLDVVTRTVQPRDVGLWLPPRTGP